MGALSTGDELIEDGAPLAPGQIRESNRTMLLGALDQAGCVPIDLGLVRDDEDALEAVLTDAAARCDAIVTSGGVSMGDFDIVKAVLDRMATMRWMQIAIRPAKPFAFGLLEGPSAVPVFGLPGNPVSSLVSFELLARPALRQMMGHSVIDRTRVRAVADEGLRRRPGRQGPLEPCRRAVRAGRRLHVRSTALRKPPTRLDRRPTASPRCPTATASSPAATSTSCSSSDNHPAARPSAPPFRLCHVWVPPVALRCDTSAAGRSERARMALSMRAWSSGTGTWSIPSGPSPLRISVTDRCNFRCTYCMPAEALQWLPRKTS